MLTGCSKLATVCGCGFAFGNGRAFGVNSDGSCCCNDCIGLDYPKDGSFPHADYCRQQKEKNKTIIGVTPGTYKLVPMCRCGFSYPNERVCVGIDDACLCSNCMGRPPVERESPDHAAHCRRQKEKENTTPVLENAVPPRKCGCGDEFGHPRKPPTAEQKGPLVKIGATHDASGYPLPGKCVCGYVLGQYDLSPKNGKCTCFVCAPSGAVSNHTLHCLQKLKDGLAEQQKTIDAQSDIITVKDDRIAELEKQLAEKEEYRSGTSYVYLGRERPESPLFVDRAVGTCEFVQSTSRNIELRFARHVDHLVICYPEEKPTRPLIRVSNGIRDPFTVSNPVEEIKRLDSVISNMRGELAESRITIAAKDKQINEQAHQLHDKDMLVAELEKQLEQKEDTKKHLAAANKSYVDENTKLEDRIRRLVDRLNKKEVQIDTMRAQMEGLEHDKETFKKRLEICEDRLDYRTNKWHKLKDRVAELEAEEFRHQHDAPLIEWLHMEETKKLQAQLDKAKAQIKELESIIAAYAKDDSCKTGVINEMREQMVHFKKYRKCIVKRIVANISDNLGFTASGSFDPARKAQNEAMISVFPELRQIVLKQVAGLLERNAIFAQNTYTIRENMIRYAKELLRDGAEHSPASGSTPESG